MTDDFQRTRRPGEAWTEDDAEAEPDDTIQPDEVRAALGTQAGAMGGAQAGVPAATFQDAGLTAHDQPVEGRRDDEDEPTGGA